MQYKENVHLSLYSSRMITGLRPVAQHSGVVDMPPSNGIDARADLANSSVFASLWLNRVAYSPVPFSLASYK